MSTTILLNERELLIRLHTHQDVDPQRSEQWGGRKGMGYLEGPMTDILYLTEQAPTSVVLVKNGSPEKELHNISWGNPELMWDDDEGYEHGLVHIDWE